MNDKAAIWIICTKGGDSHAMKGTAKTVIDYVHTLLSAGMTIVNIILVDLILFQLKIYELDWDGQKFSLVPYV